MTVEIKAFQALDNNPAYETSGSHMGSQATNWNPNQIDNYDYM